MTIRSALNTGKISGTAAIVEINMPQGERLTPTTNGKVERFFKKSCEPV
uniref:Transposase n=1 Tax=Heterorhabditis bacteriophora TaxID=37862 RepID=A0A1I7WNU1_HETBA